jgi:hypothetical protein
MQGACEVSRYIERMAHSATVLSAAADVSAHQSKASKLI